MKKTLVTNKCVLVLGCLMTAASLSFLVSCNNGSKDNKEGDAKQDTAAAVNKGAAVEDFTDRDNCIVLTRTQIAKWVKAGWDDVTDANYIPYLVFTPVTGSSINVDGCPVSSGGVLEVTKKEAFRIKSLNPPCAFLNLTINPNKYEWQAQPFADANHNLIPFDYLRLRPRPYSADGAYMSFDVEIVTKAGGGAETVTPMGETKPSPPANN